MHVLTGGFNSLCISRQRERVGVRSWLRVLHSTKPVFNSKANRVVQIGQMIWKITTNFSFVVEAFYAA